MRRWSSVRSEASFGSAFLFAASSERVEYAESARDFDGHRSLSGGRRSDDGKVHRIDADVEVAVYVFAQRRVQPDEDIVGRAVGGEERAREGIVGKGAPPRVPAVRPVVE